jgi:hypothetical protein
LGGRGFDFASCRVRLLFGGDNQIQEAKMRRSDEYDDVSSEDEDEELTDDTGATSELDDEDDLEEDLDEDDDEDEDVAIRQAWGDQ